MATILSLLMTYIGESQNDYELRYLQNEVYGRMEVVRNCSLSQRVKRKSIRSKVDTLLSINTIREELASDTRSEYQLCRRRADLLRLSGESKASYHYFKTALSLFNKEEMKVDMGYYFDAASYYHSKRWLLIRFVEVHMEMRKKKRAYMREYLDVNNQEAVAICDVGSLPADITKMNEYYAYVEENFDGGFISEYLEAYYQPLSIWSYIRMQEDLLAEYFLKNYAEEAIEEEFKRLSEELIYEADNLGHKSRIGFTFLGIDLCVYPPRDLAEFDEEKSQNIYSSFVRTSLYDRLTKSLDE